LSLCDWAWPANMNDIATITMSAMRRSVTAAPSPGALESNPAAV
jgi:hypothetical protein